MPQPTVIGRSGPVVVVLQTPDPNSEYEVSTRTEGPGPDGSSTITITVRVRPKGAATATPAPARTPSPGTPTPSPTASAAQSQWAQERVAAFVALYRVTSAGQEKLKRLQVRQTRGRPGWYSSEGYRGVTGVGEAQPASVAHELGHAYWGLFPVTGHPELSWEDARTLDESSAMRRLHADLALFMRQLPDAYEPLRERFRRLPDLAPRKDSDLFHFGEAELVGMAGGDLNLLPPTLRKYFDQYLQPGAYGTWERALRWYQDLPPEDRPVVDAYFTVAHFGLGAYGELRAQGLPPFPEEARGVIVREERQRLLDFVEQFDLLVQDDKSLRDSLDVDLGFGFWRGYLNDKLNLYRVHSTALEGSRLPRAQAIAGVLDLFLSLQGAASDERVRRVVERARQDPIALHLLPLLGNRELMAAIAALGDSPPTEVTRKGTGVFVRRLQEQAPQVDRILALGRQEASQGSRALEPYARSLKGRRDDQELFFELLADADLEVAQAMMERASDAFVRELLADLPARARFVTAPARLLRALSVYGAATDDALAQGLAALVKNGSGNPDIDEPFLDDAYTVLAERSRQNPRGVLQVLREARPPLARFLRLHPKEAGAVLSSDPDAALDLLAQADPSRYPLVRQLYEVVHSDPVAASRLLTRLTEQGRHETAEEVLIAVAYDQARSQANPGLPISVARDGIFLRELLLFPGGRWLEAHLPTALERATARTATGELPPDVLEALRRTVRAAANSGLEPRERDTILRLFGNAYQARGLPF
ncbi:MAG: hypothetical protein HY330_02010 [Chloroflexi bacterium]|nr:hypothetical protein [Chloroflexota bacterium]